MFHLLVSSSGWEQNRDEIGASRVFEYTEQRLVDFFKPSGNLELHTGLRLPSLFVTEIGGPGEQLARVGYITSALPRGKEIALEYFLDPSIPPIPNQNLREFRTSLDIDDFEFSRTHWAVKDGDLFKVLLKNQLGKLPAPTVFSLTDLYRPEEDLVAVMMPFDAGFSMGSVKYFV